LVAASGWNNEIDDCPMPQFWYRNERMYKRWFGPPFWIAIGSIFVILTSLACQLVPYMIWRDTGWGRMKIGRTVPKNLESVLNLTNLDRSFDTIEVFSDTSLDSYDVVVDGIASDGQLPAIFVNLCETARLEGYREVINSSWDSKRSVRENLATSWNWLDLPEGRDFDELVACRGTNIWITFEKRKHSNCDGRLIATYGTGHVLTYSWHRQRASPKEVSGAPNCISIPEFLDQIPDRPPFCVGTPSSPLR